MTFSIVVRETYERDDIRHTRFGVGVTTNNPGIGIFCPYVSKMGAVATQMGTHGEVGPRLLEYLNDGLPASEIVPLVLSTVDRSSVLQVHALCRETQVVHHGDRLAEFHAEGDGEYGDYVGEHYSVAGNTLENLDTLSATATAYETTNPDDELAIRLIDALAAGNDVGGDHRDIDARSAAIKIVDTNGGLANEWYNDVRIDASRTPIDDLRTQYKLAKTYHDTASEEW